MNTISTQRVVCTTILIAVVSASPADAAVTVGHTETFDAGTTVTWEGSPTPPPTVETGGPAGEGDAFILISAKGGNGPGSRIGIYNRSDDWVGDYITAGVSAVSVDMMVPVDSAELAMRLVLFGSGGTSVRWTSAEPFVVPGDGQWRNYVFEVNDQALTVVGPPEDFSTSLADVARAMIRHDDATPSRGGAPVVGQLAVDNLMILGATQLCCDYDGSGALDLADINLMLQDLRTGTGDLTFDADGNGAVDSSDLEFLVNDQFNTFIGDANLDGLFSTSDLVTVFAGGQYEDAVVGNSTWETGDWTGDGEFGTGDLIQAFAAGGFEQGPRAAVVPEPSGLFLFVWSAISWFVGRRGAR